MRYTTASEENSAAVADTARKELGIFSQRSHQKRIPAPAFRLSDDQIGLLLRHLWATGGCIWSGISRAGKRVRRVYYATTSSGLAADVAALLLRLGIVARTSTVKSGVGRISNVVVSGADEQRRFLERVGAFGPRIDQAAAMGAMLATANTNVGGTAQFEFAPSRATVASYARTLESPTPALAAQSDVFWDRVVSIKADGEEEVFDLTVPGPASWLADGIVSHNSGAIEQDADLVMFIYREEYYLKEESERPGEADIIIAKHRNGSVGDVILTFQKQYPRFMNYAGERFGG
jgi:replicative DNA helicase